MTNDKRLAEIRDVLSQPELRGDPWQMCLDLVEMLDEERKRAEDAERKLAARRAALLVAAARYVPNLRTLREEADRIERGEL